MDSSLGKIHKPPPEASGRGFLFASGGIHAGRGFRGLAGAISDERGKIDFCIRFMQCPKSLQQIISLQLKLKEDSAKQNVICKDTKHRDFYFSPPQIICRSRAFLCKTMIV
jgi:hypothetical protein